MKLPNWRCLLALVLCAWLNPLSWSVIITNCPHWSVARLPLKRASERVSSSSSLKRILKPWSSCAVNTAWMKKLCLWQIDWFTIICFAVDRKWSVGRDLKLRMKSNRVLAVKLLFNVGCESHLIPSKFRVIESICVLFVVVVRCCSWILMIWMLMKLQMDHHFTMKLNLKWFTR